MVDISLLYSAVTPVRVFVALCALLVIGNLAIRLSNRERLQFAYNTAVLAALLCTGGYMLYTGAAQSIMGLVSLNPFSLFFAVTMTAAMLLVSTLAYAYARRFDDFALMASFSLLGVYMVAFASSLITLFIGLELMVIPTVFIVLLSRRSLEAALKLFIIGSIAVALLSFAVVTLYGSTGSFAIAAAQGSGSDAMLLFAAILFIAALGFEASVFPFSILIPDVYEGSPAYATAMLGGINKKVGLIALLYILMLVFAPFRQAFIVVAALSVVTMFYGNIVALMQHNFKRMLAYSSISQAGYIMIGIAAAGPAGVGAALFQIFAHVFLFIGILAIVAWLEAHGRTEIDDLIGLSGENRFAAAAAALFMLSFIGLPFTTGFIGKFLLFTSAIGAGLLWLAVIGIINSVISLYYYARPIIAMYTTKADAEPRKMEWAVAAVVAVCLALTLVLGIYPQPLIHLTSGAATYLLAI